MGRTVAMNGHCRLEMVLAGHPPEFLGSRYGKRSGGVLTKQKYKHIAVGNRRMVGIKGICRREIVLAGQISQTFQNISKFWETDSEKAPAEFSRGRNIRMLL